MSRRALDPLFRLLDLQTAPAAAGAPAGEVVAQIEIPLACPLFAGHFPGHPILPGIAHLAVVEWVLGLLAAGDAAPPAALREVRSLRLRRPVLPGDHLELRLGHAADPGSWRCELRRAADVVSQGLVVAGATELDPRGAAPDGPAAAAAAQPGAEAVGAAGAAPGGAAGAAFPPPAALLPHGAAACLLRAVVAAGPDGIVCLAGVPDTHPLVREGTAPGFLGLEMAAQAAAALQALAQPPAAGGPPIGYLVAVRNARFPARLPAGSLRVTATPAGGAAQLAVYDLTLAAASPAAAGGAGPFATGTISTYLERS